MTTLLVSVMVLGIGIIRSQSTGYWELGAELGIILTIKFDKEIGEEIINY